jgi:hypothetical protein
MSGQVIHPSALQKWMLDEITKNEFRFTHFLTIEPTPYAPMTEDEMRRRIGKAIFRINKKYLPRGWEHREPRNKFFPIVFRQGEIGGSRKGKTNIHYHALIHSPSGVRQIDFSQRRCSSITFDLWYELGKDPNLHPKKSGRVRQEFYTKIDRALGVPPNDKTYCSIFRVERIENNKAAAIYASREHKYDLDSLTIL